MIVNIKLEDAQFQAAVASLQKRFPAVVWRAVDRAGTSAKAAMAQAIAADTGLPSRRISAKIKTMKLGASGVALVVEHEPRIPLIDFKAKGPEPSRGKGRGVTWSNPGGGRNNDPHAFIATMPGGHRGVFVRKGGATSQRGKAGKGWTTLPIRELFGPSLSNVFKKFLPLGAKRAEETLRTNLQHEINFANKG